VLRVHLAAGACSCGPATQPIRASAPPNGRASQATSLQVSPGGRCCNMLPRAWATDNIGADRNLKTALVTVLLPHLCARMLQGERVVINFDDGTGSRELVPADALVTKAAAGQALSKEDIAWLDMVIVQDIWHARQRVLEAVDKNHPDYVAFKSALKAALFLVNPRHQTLLAGDPAGLKACHDRLMCALQDMVRTFAEPVVPDRRNTVQEVHQSVAAIADMAKDNCFGEACADILTDDEDDDEAAAPAPAAPADLATAPGAESERQANVAAVLRAAPQVKPLAARMASSVTVSSQVVRNTGVAPCTLGRAPAVRRALQLTMCRWLLRRPSRTSTLEGLKRTAPGAWRCSRTTRPSSSSPLGTSPRSSWPH
jgi:hypothetical protein